MLTPTALKTYKYKDLAQMAKQRGIAGWHAMRKEQLVDALVRTAKSGRSKKKKVAVAKSTRSPKSKTTKSKTSRHVRRKIQAVHSQREQMRDLATPPMKVGSQGMKRGPSKDRIVLMVRDPYWLHAYWELKEQSVERAQAALAERWHTARPVLRLIRIASTGGEEITKVIDIHGAVNNWYIDVTSPPSSFRVEIGYLTPDSFYTLAKSNVVKTPRPGGSEMIDGNWADVVENPDRIYAMSGGFDNSSGNGELQELFEERLRRPMGSPMVTRFGSGAEAALNKPRNMPFQVDAEMIVYGMTDSDAYVTMGGEPVKLGPDGSFTARVSLPDKRQIIPIVAGRSDGVEQQTIVLAIERNTKVMEPIIREPGN